MKWKFTLALLAIASATSRLPVSADEYPTSVVSNCLSSPTDCSPCSRGCPAACAADNRCNCDDGIFRSLLGYSGYKAYGGACRKGRLFGLFTASDCRFTNFISPMTNPVYFEDPRNLTEARVIFLNHQLPSAVLGGGDVQLFATQLRAALTDRLSIIAVKDGYIFAGQDAPPIEGWANVNVGLKYNLYADPVRQRLLSLGTRIEMPVGSYRALQGNSGTSQFDIFLSGGTQLGSLSHLVSTAGFRLPADTNKQNEQFFWSLHLDRRLPNRPLYGLFELNWYHWMTNVPGGLPVGGLDLYNFGSSGVAGTNIVTGALGLKYKPSLNSEVGFCWEVPLTARRDIMDNRLTADLILRY
ncbi:MAG TPA: hypothetical protein VG826_33950 [Pirellulales bacterium]|nr:hypothetical protein [Pirellulales bacterium]